MTLLKLFIACTFSNRELGYCKSNYNNYTENVISLNTDVAGLHSFAIKRLQARNRVTIKDNNFYHRYSFLQYFNVFSYNEGFISFLNLQLQITISTFSDFSKGNNLSDHKISELDSMYSSKQFFQKKDSIPPYSWKGKLNNNCLIKILN